MKNAVSFICSAILLMSCSEAPQTPPVDEEALSAQGSDLAAQFVGSLLPTLQQAIQQGGPVNGIEVCAVQAPSIAQTLSEQSGWQVKRVSLKARNSTLAVPDEWETSVLQEFDMRQLAGEAAAQINKAELVDGEFRYMQAQPAGPLCLSCHGTDIAADVSEALARHYPDDMATGYLAGQIRGAISLRSPSTPR